jgi:hypothetical protein
MVKQCQDTVAQLGCAGDDGSDLEEPSVPERIRHRRRLKRTFIDLTNAHDDIEVRVPVHKRRRDGSAVERAREGMRLLIAAGVHSTQTLLRDLGYGGDSAKRAIAAGPAHAPGAVPGVAVAAPSPPLDDNVMVEE